MNRNLNDIIILIRFESQNVIDKGIHRRVFEYYSASFRELRFFRTPREKWNTYVSLMIPYGLNNKAAQYVIKLYNLVKSLTEIDTVWCRFLKLYCVTYRAYKPERCKNGNKASCQCVNAWSGKLNKFFLSVYFKFTARPGILLLFIMFITFSLKV